jgi:hypothetical protein
MTEKDQKDLLTRFADAGEEMLTRLGSSDRVSGAMTSMREQLDSLAQKVRGIDQLEKRIEELEQKVEELGREPTSPARKPRKSASSGSKPEET